MTLGKVKQGLYPFPKKISRTFNFQDFTKTQADFSRIPNFTFNSFIPRISKSMLITIYKNYVSYDVNSENFYRCLT